MKLRQGHCVATAGINEDNLQQVLSVFRASGCLVENCFSPENIKYFNFLEWYGGRLAKADSVENIDLLLTVDQILGSDEKPHFDFSRRSDSGKNDWYERGELPPVGTIVEFCNKPENNERICVDDWREGDHLEVIAIRRVHLSDLPIVFNTRDHTASAIMTRHIRPLKSERERSIEQMVAVIKSVPEYNDFGVAETLYDAGFRKEGK